MVQSQHTSVDHPWWKAATALLASIGIGSWSDFAAMVAAIYSVLLIGEWFWRRFGRSFCESHGWIAPRLRRRSDQRADKDME